MPAPNPKPAAPADAARDSLQVALAAWLARHDLPTPTPTHPLAVAYSGGLDSTALLFQANALWPGAVCAIHVNHGLQSLADGFEAHCCQVCEAWGVHLAVQGVQVTLQTGDSLEEQARLSRYAALSACARALGAQAVLLAQHADDQAETVLLALSRGSGVAGLAAMGEWSQHGGVVFGRPWLGVRQSVLRLCVAVHGLAFMDDPTNADTRFTRNRLRHDLMPVMTQAFPSIVGALGRTARHCAEANQLLQALAQQDLLAVGLPPHLAQVQMLPAARQANLLRQWLLEVAGRAPSTAQLDELRKQIAAATTRGHRIHLRVGSGWVKRQGGTLAFSPA